MQISIFRKDFLCKLLQDQISPRNLPDLADSLTVGTFLNCCHCRGDLLFVPMDIVNIVGDRCNPIQENMICFLCSVLRGNLFRTKTDNF